MGRSGLLTRLREIPADDPALEPLGIDGAALPLRRAWPRSGAGLTLEYACDDTVVAAQWFPEPDRARALVRKMASERVVLADVAGETVVLQAGGADRRLPALAGLLSHADARLVAHRAERRATVARPGVFVKVLPPGRVEAVATAHRSAGGRDAAVVVPPVLRADDRVGTLELGRVAGAGAAPAAGTPRRRAARARRRTSPAPVPSVPPPARRRLSRAPRGG